MLSPARCDIAISVATGQAPVFFSGTEPEYRLPDIAVPREERVRRVPTTDSELARIWTVFDHFCISVNKAVVNRERLPERLLLDTAVPVMYRLLNLSTFPASMAEAIRLAMLSLGTCTFLNWPQLRIPVERLKYQYEQSLKRLMQPDSDQCDPMLLLWLLAIYGITFPFPRCGQIHELQTWLLEVADRCGCMDWSEAKAATKSFLWIDIVCEHEATKLFHDVFSRSRKDVDVTERESELDSN